MDRILSEQFVTQTLLPYLKKNILGNAGNDLRLQKIFTKEEPLTEEEKKGLVADPKYFNDGTSVFKYDENLRKLFWNNFIDFVRRQKRICSGNIGLLAKRLLPLPGTNSFENEAQENLLKFSYQVANAVQDYKIEQTIKNMLLSGEINETEANKLRSKLAQGKLVMLKDKKGGKKLVNDDEIRRASEKGPYQDDFYSSVESSGEGEDRVVYPDEIPPEETEGQPKFEEKGMTVSNVALEIYEKQATQVEIMLEESGLHVESKLKTDKTGTVRGYVVIIQKRGDKTITERMRIEVKVNKPNQLFQFTLLDKGKSFTADKNEIKKYFKDEQKLGSEVSELKGEEKMENPKPFPPMAPVMPRKKALPEEKPKEGLAAVSRIPEGQGNRDLFQKSSAGVKSPINIIAAKYTYLRRAARQAARRKKILTGMPTAAAPEPQINQPAEPFGQPQPGTSGVLRTRVPTPPVEVKKSRWTPGVVTAAATIGGLGGPIVFSLFT